MQTNYLHPINERSVSLRHLVSIYRKHISAPAPLNTDEPICNYYGMIFIEKGKSLINIGEKSVSVNEGQLIFIPYSHYYSIKSLDGEKLTYIYIAFVCDSDLFKCFPVMPIKFNDRDFKLILDALDKIESLNCDTLSDNSSNFFKNYNTYMQMAYNSIELFFLNLSYYPAVKAGSESFKQTRHANISASVEEYLKEHIRGNISLQETAQHFGYSVSNIQKIFKAVTGKSIIVYFNHLKLEEAKRLIAENNMSFSQISNYLSFSNPNYFSRIFKTTVGVTPTEYAALHKKKKNINKE